ncbi:benzoate transporter [Paenibacillus baekrokdamisoli]|uniref:Benzoate transporter n=1 Tax=Paenibacillus baekrokdamisoli TaxID=1712516 RepID=A0A3G9JCW8_9BACL|nr:benzoate/H(+) symporter BenE family transporter [Paenibacillus baekrokdamisoli]MBB3071703.1 benzoate membrane transport protein [Paenibacillus baekrokdamisoli]BBH21788.1 benzoate transporter [Paenibacillus baekrokdamisoli]
MRGIERNRAKDREEVKPAAKINVQNVLSGVLSALLPCTGGTALILSSAEHAGFTNSELISWLFVVYFFGGLFNLVLSVIYKIPFGGAHSITAAAFLSTTAVHYHIDELAGSVIMAGMLIVFFGLSGFSAKLLEWLPKPLLEAMLAGLIFTHIAKMIPAFKENYLLGVIALLGFLLVSRVSRKVPPVLGVVALGLVYLALVNDFPAGENYSFVWPHNIMPSFSVNGFVSLSIPLAILILSNDVFVGLAALRKNGYQPPVAKSIVFTGMATAFAGWFGGHAVNIGGMMSMVCSDERSGPKEHRYIAGIVSGGLVALFGLLAWKVVAFMSILPTPFILLITGFSLIGLFMQSMKSTFRQSSYRYAALITFIIAVFNVSYLGISAPVWCMLIGLITAKILGEGRRDIIKP